MRWAAVLLASWTLGCGRIGFGEAPTGMGDGGLELPALAPCAPSNLDLVACWAFEGDTRDSSVNGNHGTGTDIAYEVGGPNGAAAHLGDTSVIAITETPSLDIPETITLEAWIRLDSLPPAGARSVIIDAQDQYSFSVLPTGINCLVRNELTVDVVIPVDAWVHLACTYDGAVLEVWVDGQSVGARDQVVSIPTGNLEGTRLGSNLQNSARPDPDRLLGGLDQVRIWRISRSAAELCAAAGSCP